MPNYIVLHVVIVIARSVDVVTGTDSFYRYHYSYLWQYEFAFSLFSVSYCFRSWFLESWFQPKLFHKSMPWGGTTCSNLRASGLAALRAKMLLKWILGQSVQRRAPGPALWAGAQQGRRDRPNGTPETKNTNKQLCKQVCTHQCTIQVRDETTYSRGSSRHPEVLVMQTMPASRERPGMTQNPLIGAGRLGHTQGKPNV